MFNIIQNWFAQPPTPVYKFSDIRIPPVPYGLYKQQGNLDHIGGLEALENAIIQDYCTMSDQQICEKYEITEDILRWIVLGLTEVSLN